MCANIFDYATKELSQDAFLRWLFESYKNPEIKPIVIDFINYFTQNQEDEYPPLKLVADDITKIKTFAQYGDIDVSIDIYHKKAGEKEYDTIAIEDKTTSEEHNQLETYSDRIKKWGGNHVYKVFYKTNIFNKYENERVKNANWTPFYLNDIHAFFIKYKDSTHSDVLNDYIKHLEQLMEDSKYDKKPDDNNLLRWRSYFEHIVTPKIYEELPADYFTWDTFYGYTYLNVRPLNKDHKITPYLEIRSRDCLGDNFNARILLYGVDEKIELGGLKEIIARSELFHRENYSKQIGSTKKKLTSHSEDKFVNNVKISVEEYLRIMAEWENQKNSKDENN